MVVDVGPVTTVGDGLLGCVRADNTFTLDCQTVAFVSDDGWPGVFGCGRAAGGTFTLGCRIVAFVDVGTVTTVFGEGWQAGVFGCARAGGNMFTLCCRTVEFVSGDG